MTVVYPLTLYCLGLWVSIAFFRSLTPTLLAWTSFLWGALIWCIGQAVMLITTIGATPLSMGLWCSAWLIGAAWMYWRQPRTDVNLTTVATITLIFGVTMFAAQFIRFPFVSPDSIKQLLVAEALITNPFPDNIYEEFGSWGLMLPAIHSAAFWVGAAAWPTIQAAFAWSLLGVFGAASHQATEEYRRWLPTALLLGMTYFVVFQAAYIHNSIIAAAFLLPAVVLLSRAHTDDTAEHLYPAMLLFVGFAFTRTESVLYVCLFVALAVSYGHFTSWVWWRVMLPYVAITLIWQMWLLTIIVEDAIILTPERIMLLIIAIVGTFLSPLMLWVEPVRVFVANWMVRGMALLLFGIMLIDPNHMVLSSLNSLSNLMIGGTQWWGMIWIFTLVSVILLRGVPRLYFARILSSGVVGFIVMTLLISYARNPFREGWGDSANRMFTHVLPIALFYVTLRINAFARMGDRTTNDLITNETDAAAPTTAKSTQ